MDSATQALAVALEKWQRAAHTRADAEVMAKALEAFVKAMMNEETI